MTYSAIDGDISDFLDSQLELRKVFRTEELRSYLLNEGHSLEEVTAALVDWQRGRFVAVDPDWKQFSLSADGESAVAELRDRLDSGPTLGRC